MLRTPKLVGIMRRAFLIFCALAIALLGATIARGEVEQNGNLRLNLDAGFTPRTLPRDKEVPVRVDFDLAVKTTDGSTPPQLKSVALAVNSYGKLSTQGLPACQSSRLEATSSEAALARCRSALVGRGRFGANVDFPNIEFPVKGRMLAFNSRLNGRPAIALHVYGSNPVEATIVLMFKISYPTRGRFGTVLSTKIPQVAAELGYVTDLSLTFSRRYRYKGEARSFLSARCAAPAGFPGALFAFARVSFAFSNEQTLSPTLTRDCLVAH